MDLYSNFLNQYDYDIRKSRNARWIDQKCSFDVLSIIADCIVEYVKDGNQEFTVADIWHSEYAVENVVGIFSKPNPKSESKNEYDKYFGQPIKLLVYSKILNFRKVNNRYYYHVNNQNILEQIALKPYNALNFLHCYIIKVLKDSELYESFDNFFQSQTKESYYQLRKDFINFTIENTAINHETECGRIFTKVINPLAFKFKKLGSIKGKISSKIITIDELQYNRFNWFDQYTGKEKFISRSLYKDYKFISFNNYQVNKAKKIVKNYNSKYNNSLSEVLQVSEQEKATQAHHIFP